MCSTLAVKLKVTSGCSACSARAMRSACVGPLRKSGSPKSMWRAPAAICARASSSTTSAGTAKKRPLVHGRDRTVPAQVLAAARRLDVAGDAPLVRDRQPRVLRRARASAPRSGTSDGRRPGGRGPRRTARRRLASDSRQRDELRSRNRARARCPPRAASSARFSVAYMPKKQRCARGFARRTCAATRRPSTSAVCIGTEIATSRAAARRARAASSSGSIARSRQVGWNPAPRRCATADATPCGWCPGS